MKIDTFIARRPLHPRPLAAGEHSRLGGAEDRVARLHPMEIHGLEAGGLQPFHLLEQGRGLIPSSMLRADPGPPAT